MPRKEDMRQACMREDVKKVKQLLQESPSLLNKHLDMVFFFFMVELFLGYLVVMF